MMMGVNFKTTPITPESAAATLAAVGELGYTAWCEHTLFNRNDYSTLCVLMGRAGLAQRTGRGRAWVLAVPLAEALARLPGLPWETTKFAKHGPKKDIGAKKPPVRARDECVTLRVRPGVLPAGMWYVHDSRSLVPAGFYSEREAVQTARGIAHYLSKKHGVAVVESRNARGELIVALSAPVPGGRAMPLTAK